MSFSNCCCLLRTRKVDIYLFNMLPEIKDNETLYVLLRGHEYGLIVFLLVNIPASYFSIKTRTNICLCFIGLLKHYPNMVKIRVLIRVSTNSSTNALSFYRSQIVLCWTKYFVPAQKFDCIQCLFKNFCAGTKTNFTECKSSFCLAQNVCDCHNM